MVEIRLVPQAVRSVAQSLTAVGEVGANLNGAGQSHSCGAELIVSALNAFESDVTSMVTSVRSLIGGIGTQTHGAVADLEAAEETNVEALRQIRFPDEYAAARPGSLGAGGGGRPGAGRRGEPRYTDPGVDLPRRHRRYDFPPGEEPRLPDRADKPEQSETPEGFSIPAHNMRYDLKPGDRPIYVPEDNRAGPYIYHPDENVRPPIHYVPKVRWGGPVVVGPGDRPPVPPAMPASEAAPKVPRQFDRDSHPGE